MVRLINNFKKLDKYTQYAIYVILLAFLLRITIAILGHPAGDSCWHLSAASFLRENSQLPVFEKIGRAEAFSYPPLFYLLTNGFYYVGSFFGSISASIFERLVSPFFGFGIIILTFLISKKLFDSKVAFYSVLFASFVPFMVFNNSIPYVDTVFSFFIILSIYLAMRGNIIFSGVSAGLAGLTKLYGFFVLPVLILYFFLNKKTNKDFFKKSGIVIAIFFAITSIHYVSNINNFGNPVYPFFQNIVAKNSNVAVPGELYTHPGFSQLFDPTTPLRLFSGFFGVPNDDYTLVFFSKSSLGLFISFSWFAFALVFFLPFVFGLFLLKYFDKKIIFIFGWIFGFLFVVFSSIVALNAPGAVQSRHLLPAIPAIALVWGVGFNFFIKKISFYSNQKNKNKTVKKLFLKLVLFSFYAIVFLFCIQEVVKGTFSGSQWSIYQEDFLWIQKNTPKNAIFADSGQCFYYNTKRGSIQNPLQITNNSSLFFIYYDNNNFVKPASTSADFSSFLNQSVQIYQNPKTGLRIFEYLPRQ